MEREPTPQELKVLEAQDQLEDNILESLLAEARAAAVAQAPKRRRTADPTQPHAREDHRLWSDPSNWTRTTGVALMHKETQTLLGNFSEYVHASVKGARKLIREAEPISVTKIEEVTGTWWLGADRTVEPRRQWHETRKAAIKVHLAELGVFAPLVMVTAHLAFGGIARVELDEATEFADSDGRQLMTLPAGTNILPCMTFDGKLFLRREIGL